MTGIDMAILLAVFVAACAVDTCQQVRTRREISALRTHVLEVTDELIAQQPEKLTAALATKAKRPRKPKVVAQPSPYSESADSLDEERRDTLPDANAELAAAATAGES